MFQTTNQFATNKHNMGKYEAHVGSYGDMLAKTKLDMME